MNTIQAKVQMGDLMAPTLSKAQGQLEKSQSETFKSLLESALQEQPVQSERPAVENQGISREKEGERQETPATEKKPADESVAAMAVVVQQPVQPTEPDGQMAAILDGALARQVLEATGENGGAARLMDDLAAQALPEQTVEHTVEQTQPEIPILSVETDLPAQEAPVVEAQAAPPMVVTPEEDARQQQSFDQKLTAAKENLIDSGDMKFQRLVYPTKIMDAEPVPSLEIPEDMKLEETIEPPEKPVEAAPVVQVLEKSMRATVSEQEETKSELISALSPAPQPEAKAPEVRPAESQPIFRQAPAEQVRDQVIEHLEQEKMEFRMQLQPQELGRIDVKLVLESGRLTVEIIAATAKTTELLTRQAEGLAASLRLSGIDLQSVQVVPGTENQQSHMEQSLSMMMGQSGGSREEQEQGSQGPGPQDRSTAQTLAEEPEEPHTLLNYKV